MPRHADYLKKFDAIADKTPFSHLPDPEQQRIKALAQSYRFTLQELRLVSEIAQDLTMWGQGGIDRHWPAGDDGGDKRQQKRRLIQGLQQRWEALRHAPNHYPPKAPAASVSVPARALERRKEKLGLGFCPVASPRTRCCNLLTLDAVDNCGYGCAYCSIQSFFTDNQVYFDPDFADKLAALEIDPERIYHIGTGQSSDSLMWGNSHGILDALIDFAWRHPNVILELKTKSANISHLLRQPLPPNLLCTWSLNPDTIIRHEEHGTAPLQKRLQAAARVAAHGGIVGFHFHPMIHFDGWRPAYGGIFTHLQRHFEPRQVAMVSLGTLTFIKPVIRQIRQRGNTSQILKLPLVESDGKLSYPDEIKLALFRHAYDAFCDDWREQVFFYLCMENQRLWQPVFGFDYACNEAFETAMKRSYMAKIDAAREAMA